MTLTIYHHGWKNSSWVGMYLVMVVVLYSGFFTTYNTILHLQYVCIHIEYWLLWLHLMGVFQGGQKLGPFEEGQIIWF